jgi:hypothetical protein
MTGPAPRASDPQVANAKPKARGPVGLGRSSESDRIGTSAKATAAATATHISAPVRGVGNSHVEPSRVCHKSAPPSSAMPTAVAPRATP